MTTYTEIISVNKSLHLEISFTNESAQQNCEFNKEIEGISMTVKTMPFLKSVTWIIKQKFRMPQTPNQEKLLYVPFTVYYSTFF